MKFELTYPYLYLHYLSHIYEGLEGVLNAASKNVNNKIHITDILNVYNFKLNMLPKSSIILLIKGFDT